MRSAWQPPMALSAGQDERNSSPNTTLGGDLESPGIRPASVGSRERP